MNAGFHDLNVFDIEFFNDFSPTHNTNTTTHRDKVHAATV
jgi:hypothetical protein